MAVLFSQKTASAVCRGMSKKGWVLVHFSFWLFSSGGSFGWRNKSSFRLLFVDPLIYFDSQTFRSRKKRVVLFHSTIHSTMLSSKLMRSGAISKVLRESARARMGPAVYSSTVDRSFASAAQEQEWKEQGVLDEHGLTKFSTLRK